MRERGGNGRLGRSVVKDDWRRKCVRGKKFSLGKGKKKVLVIIIARGKEEVDMGKWMWGNGCLVSKDGRVGEEGMW